MHANHQEVNCMYRECCGHNREPERVSNTQVRAFNQDQDQDVDQDQRLRSVFRNIGNGDVVVKIDNESVAVLVLASLGLVTGALDPATYRGYIDKLMTRPS
jgi:hypothetical protein